MRISLIFLALSVLLLFPIRADELTNSSDKLLIEIDYLLTQLNSISKALSETKLSLNSALQMNEQERIASQKKIESLEADYNQTKQEKSQLEKQLQALKESEGTPAQLQTEFESYDKLATSQIRLWKIIAIGEAVLIAGTLTVYLILSAR